MLVQTRQHDAPLLQHFPRGERIEEFLREVGGVLAKQGAEFGGVLLDNRGSIVLGRSGRGRGILQLGERFDVEEREQMGEIVVLCEERGGGGRGQMGRDDAEIADGEGVSAKSGGLVLREPAKVLRGVVDVLAADAVLLVDEAAKHQRGVLLVDLLAALEDQLFVGGLQPEQNVRQYAKQLRALWRSLAVLLHLEEHHLDGLRVSSSPKTNAFVLLLALEEVEQREREHQARLLGHRGLDRLHQPLFDQRHVAVIRAQQEALQLLGRLQRDQREHQRRVHARQRLRRGRHGFADVAKVLHQRFVGVAARSHREQRHFDGALRDGRRRELEVLVEIQHVFHGAAAVLEVLNGLIEAVLREEIKRGIEVELVDHLHVQRVIDRHRKRLREERRVLLREELDLVLGSQQTQLIHVLRRVEQKGRRREIVVRNDRETPLERDALDASQVHQIVHVEIVAHQHE